jgi:hypothetical protein
MTAVAVFDVKTNVSNEVIKSVLTELWVYRSVSVMLNTKTKFTICVLEYVFHTLEEEKSIKDIVEYLFNISLESYIYYYPDWECYEYDKEDVDIEISVDDIFRKEEYEPSLNSPFGYARFIIKEQ